MTCIANDKRETAITRYPESPILFSNLPVSGKKTVAFSILEKKITDKAR